ncbi:MAG: hypothetical protein QF754_14760 [Alphaproteobacteria bacterium]|nr:hypothetical protein [Alphaproteobacteria bacterium]
MTVPRAVFSTSPAVEHRDADLIAWELEFEERLVDYAQAAYRLRDEPNVMGRIPLHEHQTAALERIAALQASIRGTKPTTLAGAAVQLRRALAAVEGHDCRDPHRRDSRAEVPLLRSVLAVVEGAVATPLRQPERPRNNEGGRNAPERQRYRGQGAAAAII